VPTSRNVTRSVASSNSAVAATRSPTAVRTHASSTDSSIALQTISSTLSSAVIRTTAVPVNVADIRSGSRTRS